MITITNASLLIITEIPTLFKMYVCVCHAVTENDIRDAVSQGASGLDELRERLCLATSCGACVSEARTCLDRELNKSYAAQKVAA